MKIALITWEDSAHLQEGWEHIEEIRGLCDEEHICLTVGFILRTTKKYICVVQSTDSKTMTGSNSLKIPMSAIREVKIIGEAKK